MVNVLEEGGSDVKEEKDSSMQKNGGRSTSGRRNRCAKTPRWEVALKGSAGRMTQSESG